MYLRLCDNNKCGHEFHSDKDGACCNWCGASSVIIKIVKAPPIQELAEKVFEKIRDKRIKN